MSVPLKGIVINGVEIKDTFAEAFPMVATRIIITAVNYKWAKNAANTMVGFATSVIGCDVEAGIERKMKPSETPDGRTGFSILLFAMSQKALSNQLTKRVAQCVLTCPTSAVFAGIVDKKKDLPLGKYIRYFGDGYQISKVIGNTRYWRIPVMDGEFLCEESTSSASAIGGGNFLIMANSMTQALHACEAAIDAISSLPNLIMPFPGGGVRSGSKVGSRYKWLSASTHEAYCPTLKGLVPTSLRDDTAATMEIVIDGLSVQDIINAMRIGIGAVCELGLSQGITTITAGHYGGRLGPYHFHLWEIMGA